MDPKRIEHLVKSGNDVSLKELFEHFYGKIFATVMSLVRNRQWAEDITQEAFIRGFLQIKNLREPAKFAPWMATIATNMARDFMKREKKYLLSPEPYLKEPVPETSPVEAEMLKNEKKRHILNTLHELSEEQYQVVILFYYYDQKIDDIADLLQVSPGTVKSRLHRSREKLSTLLI